MWRWRAWGRAAAIGEFVKKNFDIPSDDQLVLDASRDLFEFELVCNSESWIETLAPCLPEPYDAPY